MIVTEVTDRCAAVRGAGLLGPREHEPPDADAELLARLHESAAGLPHAGTAAGARDKVDINSVASQLHQLEHVLNDVSIVDGARVDAIKQAISSGQFKVNSEVVADKLLASVKEHIFTPKP